MYQTIVDEAWFQNIPERQKKELLHTLQYVEEYRHGTDGHLAKYTIGLLVDLLRAADSNLNLHMHYDQLVELYDQTVGRSLGNITGTV